MIRLHHQRWSCRCRGKSAGLTHPALENRPTFCRPCFQMHFRPIKFSILILNCWGSNWRWDSIRAGNGTEEQQTHTRILDDQDQQRNIDGLVQERCNSSALAMELRLFGTNPSICHQYEKLHKTQTLCMTVGYTTSIGNAICYWPHPVCRLQIFCTIIICYLSFLWHFLQLNNSLIFLFLILWTFFVTVYIPLVFFPSIFYSGGGNICLTLRMGAQ